MRGLKAVKVIYNDPATIVYWEDGSRTVVKVKPGERFDEEIGFLYAFFERHSTGTKGENKRYLAEVAKGGYDKSDDPQYYGIKYKK